MFERWLRRTRDELLDLPRHQPSDFEGKIVVLNEREYVVGANVRTGDQGYAHRLVNRRSGLCMHVIQIRPEYQRDPDAAWALSSEKQASTAHLRDSLIAEGSVDQIPVITAQKACGGSFELHEMSGEFGDETPMTAGENISAANAMEKDRDYRGAISLLQRVVAEYPDHTIALNNLAHCHCQLGEYVDALAPIEHAVAVEPNHSRYRGSHLYIALHCPARRNAAPLHEELKRHFPHVGDYDFYGVQAYLRIGKPERAREILTNAKLPKAYSESLGATVESAVQARKRYDSLRSELWANEHRDPSRESVLPFLEEVHAAYDVDPDIQASLGFRLRAAGEYERASQLLIRAAGGIDRALEAECLANAGYCLIMLGEWPRAMYLLDAVMNALEARGAANPYDIPGIVDWIGDQGMSIETMQPSAAEVLNRALLECPDKSLITPAVEKMAALLRQFAARYSGAVPRE